MPLLAAWMGSLFSGIVGFFSSWLTKRVALVLTGITVIVSLTAAFITAIDALYTAMAVTLPTEIVIGASWFLPTNTSACISAYISAHLLRWAYDWNTKVIQLKLF
ncbi:MAG: DUF5455 family protein [Gammaproteobacteria bacterium]|nr:DUF5455 family protein [Gammaproteobacteria bacterium]